MELKTYAGPITSNRKGRSVTDKTLAIREALLTGQWIELPAGWKLTAVRTVGKQVERGVQTGTGAEGVTVFRGVQKRAGKVVEAPSAPAQSEPVTEAAEKPKPAPRRRAKSTSESK